MATTPSKFVTLVNANCFEPFSTSYKFTAEGYHPIAVLRESILTPVALYENITKLVPFFLPSHVQDIFIDRPALKWPLQYVRVFSEDLETLLQTEDFTFVYVMGWTDYLAPEEEPRTAQEKAREARRIENRRIEFDLVFTGHPLEEVGV